MRSVTASLDYLKTLRQDEVVAFALIYCILPSLFIAFYDVIRFLIFLYYNGIGRSLAIGSVFVLVLSGIFKFCLYISNTYPYTSRLLSSLISIIFCCFTLIWAVLYGEFITAGALHLLRLLYKSSLIPRSSQVIRSIHHYRFIPITPSRRYGIFLRFTGILLVFSMILIALIPYIFSTPRPKPQLMFYIVICFLQYELPPHQSFSSFYKTVTDWSHLPLDLVREIVNQMTTFKDYIAAKGVSQDWRSAHSSISRGPLLPLPALMLSEPLLTDMRTLFSLYDNSHHRLQLSEVRGKRIWGSQHGWIVTLGSRYVTQLVHLMTGNRINLPQIQRLAPREEWFCLVRKFNLLKDPTDESTFLVIAIFGPMNSLSFTRVRLGAALNRRGEGEWVVVANPENLKFMDVSHFNDQIYALCDNGKLVRFEPDAPSADMVHVIADHPQDVAAHRKIYLVESLRNLYGVFRNGFLIPSERRFETTSFFVYKFNFNASAWEEVTHLEGHTFFVGDGNSFSWNFPTSIIPSRSDCIYFTDDHWDWRKFTRSAYGGHDVGLFHMEIREIIPLTFGKDKPCFYSRPIFVTRNELLLT